LPLDKKKERESVEFLFFEQLLACLVRGWDM